MIQLPSEDTSVHLLKLKTVLHHIKQTATDRFTNYVGTAMLSNLTSMLEKQAQEKQTGTTNKINFKN